MRDRNDFAFMPQKKNFSLQEKSKQLEQSFCEKFFQKTGNNLFATVVASDSTLCKNLKLSEMTLRKGGREKQL